MWEVRIQNAIGRFAKELVITRRIGDKYEVLRNDLKTADVVNNGDPLDIEKHVFLIENDVFDAIVDAVHKDFKPSEGKFTEGKLEATESHLSDLRQLLKLK